MRDEVNEEINNLSHLYANEVIVVGSRSSALARAQLAEVAQLLQVYYPQLHLEPLWLETRGDKDKQSSLRELEKSDFFTREIDEALQQNRCRIAVHSAKDLPEPLTAGLCLAALTKGVDPADALVVRPGLTLQSLPAKAKVATSSWRRQHSVSMLLPEAQFFDLRGTIEERLEQLHRGHFDAIVMAEAALLRLNLTHYTRYTLPGPPATNQGKLAVLARSSDDEMHKLLQPIHAQ